MKRSIIKLVLLSLMLMMVSACVPRTQNVVVTNYPTEFLMTRLAGNRVNISRLDSGEIPQLATIHNDYEAIIKNADVLFYINELQPYWELYKDDITSAKVKMIDLSERSGLYAFNRYTDVVVNNQTHYIESSYYEGLANPDTYVMDPFLWMDPLSMTSMARTMLDWLVSVYPDDAAIFQENFDALEIDLVRLQAEMQASDDDGEVEIPVRIATMTPSFGNWQKSYGIGIYPLVLSKYGVLPNKAELDIIRERLIRDGVRYIASEEGMNEEYTALYNQIKTELNLTEIDLNNGFTLSAKDIESNNDYITKMYQNLETLEAVAH
ncbi:MAG: zinc ABC transporter solute-binding protein [Erysipelothrix sp.]|nr:zinc ABC transporter solute-binding protein [Erysipelothrix sp.]